MNGTSNTSWRAALLAKFEARKRASTLTTPPAPLANRKRKVKERPPFYGPPPRVGARLEVRVVGKPVGQPRPKARYVKPKHRPGFIQFYDPHDADEWKAAVKRAFFGMGGVGPIECPVRCTIDVLLPRPQYLRTPWYVQNAPGELPAICKPDFDNLAKSTCDAITDYGIWKDDALVCKAVVDKFYHAIDQLPGARIVIEVLPPIPTPPKRRQIAEQTAALFPETRNPYGG